MTEQVDNADATAFDVNENVIIDYVHVDYPGVMDKDEEEAVTTTVGKLLEKPSFIDILKSSPNLQPVENKKRPSNNINVSTRNVTNNNLFGGLDVKPVVDRVAVRAAEKRVWEAESAKTAIQQRVELKEAACKEAKHVYEAAVSDEKALRGLLKAKNVEISEAQSALKKLRSSGAVEDVLEEVSGTKMVLLADGMKSIHHALHSSGIGIHDLDWTQLADELLKPLKKEVGSLKEDIQKAVGLSKASKKNYDMRTEELKVLKGQLREAEGVFQEANREFMRFQNKEITEENGDFIAEEEEENQDTYASNLPCIGQMELGHQDNESCKKDAASNSGKLVENKTKNICTVQTMDETPSLEVGCNSEQALVSEQGWNIKEVDDVVVGDLVEEATNEEEVKKVILSEIELDQEDTINESYARADPQLIFKKKKKPNKRTKKALAKAELKAHKENINGENEDVCIGQIVVNPHSFNADSEQAIVSEEASEELDADGDLSQDIEKAELSEIAEEETTKDDNHNDRPNKTYKNKKKQKKLARKAARAKAAELKALKDDGAGTLPDGLRFVLSNSCAAISLVVMLLMVWFAL